MGGKEGKQPQRFYGRGLLGSPLAAEEVAVLPSPLWKLWTPTVPNPDSNTTVECSTTTLPHHSILDVFLVYFLLLFLATLHAPPRNTNLALVWGNKKWLKVKGLANIGPQPHVQWDWNHAIILSYFQRHGTHLRIHHCIVISICVNYLLPHSK